ncbi:uncharacterized protein LOC114947214 [Acropora millepora]|uniref:uncharacterized protein LOC114947214 n=1 Tax=Acropora millepora TaxID=45264 RepID=UPI001CF38384|nr:uncharacterized protein LOC114947214 [Acropora millepora]XP_044177170.1 uncharacterized protein LOC114947214 [Acropora millepora]
MENTGRKTPSLVETEEEECFLEPWTVVSIMSLSSDDEMSDEEPSPVETAEKYPKETLTVDSTASIPVARELVITQGKRLEALGDLQSLKYEKGAHECQDSQKSDNVDNEELEELLCNSNTQSSSGPSTVGKISQFVRRVGFYVGYTIVKYNLISHM